MDTSIEEYLEPTDILDSDHPDVVQFADNTVEGTTDPVEQAIRLFYAVRDQIAYDVRVPFYLPEHYRASNILKWKRGYCVPKASLLCASGRAVGIPSRLGFADIRNRGATKEVIAMLGSDIFAYHSFVEFLLEGKWVRATPAFDAPIFERHRIAPVEFDGRSDAMFPSEDLDGNPYVEYLIYHGSFADVPLEPILEAWVKYYGPDRVSLWIEGFENNQNTMQSSFHL
ncbi:MAG: transglutaminase-like domain-containing protein [Deltaproteobacteria bacterium]